MTSASRRRISGVGGCRLASFVLLTVLGGRELYGLVLTRLMPF